MLNPKTLSFIHSAYSCVTVLTNCNTLDRLKRNNTQPFIKEVVDLTLDHDILISYINGYKIVNKVYMCKV